MNKQTDRRLMEIQTDRQTNGRTEQTNGQTEGQNRHINQAAVAKEGDKRVEISVTTMTTTTTTVTRLNDGFRRLKMSIAYFKYVCRYFITVKE